jgi:hypothetical protein
MDSTENVPARIQAEAKAKALAILATEPGCISYVRPEDLETAALFIPIVSIIKPTHDDFYDPIPGIGIMAKPPLVNLLREKAGIEILRTETEKRGEYIWHAHVYGQRRQPDGTMIPDDSSYEFDAEKRAELDAINQPTKYGTEIAKRKHLLELAKFGDQRAVTGAQHSLIHKLAHVARSFKTPEELMKGMKVLRIDRNINGIMADPNMREAIINHALGATEQVFGPKQIKAQAEASPAPRTGDPETGEMPAAQAAEAGQVEIEFKDDIPWDEKPEDIARRKLESFLALEKKDARLTTSDGWKSASDLIRAMLDNKETSLAAMNDLAKRVEAWLAKNGVKGVPA